ncbi:MAG: hypothetical protein H6591_06620 [Flavobacteriales bacterium]|nr:hypothetical protein [Flavobacteriales bacterium]
MERRYFKLNQGYLNIDAEALMFTRSGNWQEAANTEERTTKLTAGRTLRLTTGIGLILVGGLFLSLGELRHTLREGSFILAIGLGGFGMYKMYQLLNDDMGRSFRIPFAKLTALTCDEEHLDISFLNGAFKEERMRVKAPAEACRFAESAWKDSRNGA